MPTDRSIRGCRGWYARLLRLYPRRYRERFGEEMEQTFEDLCRAREQSGQGLMGLLVWTFLETFAAIVRENATMLLRCFMNRGSTIFLRLVLSMIAIGALAVCVFALPGMISREAAKTPETAWQIYLFLVGAYIQAALFLFALFQTFRLLSYIDRDMVFSEVCVRALRGIKRAALTIGLLMLLGVGWVLFLSAGTGEDSAGPVMIGFIGTFASSIVAAVTAVVQTQVQGVIHGRGSRLPASVS